MTEWTDCTLGDVLTLQRGFDLPLQERKAGTFPIIASTGPVGVHHEAQVTAPGVVIGRSGSIGGGQFITTDFWPLNTTLWVKDFKGNHPRFCYYLLRGIDFSSFNVGSGVPTLNRNHVHPLPVTIPQPHEQAQIAGLLGALDDKIELNRRMNETLEAMAQAIFRDWFVDFGPVRRKLEGTRDPVAIMGGLMPDPARAAELAGLFPDGFGEGDLPAGWSERPIDQIAEFLNGLALQKFPAGVGEPSLPVIKIAELRGGLTDKSNRAATNLPERFIVRDGDFIFSWSGSLMAKVWTEGDGALNQHLFKVTSTGYPQWFFARWVLHHMPEFQSIAASKATTMGHIQRGHLSSASTVCPPRPLLNEMTKVMGPLWEQAIQNELQNRTLAQTRDYLLPRLMSGEVQVGDVDQGGVI
jgi:type I restriction enzyme S subunit